MGTESGLRQRIRAAIRAYDPAVMIVGQPANGMTGPGRHDLYLVVGGRYVGLEVKTSTGRATQIQLGRIRDTRRAGGYAWLVRSTAAACWAVRLVRTGAPMAFDSEFDIDKLLASFRPDDPNKPWPEEQALSGEEPEADLNRPIAGFVPSEEHIANAAQNNGTAAGDGEALGAIPSSTEILARAIDNLAVAVTRLYGVVQELKADRQTLTSAPNEATLAALLGVIQEGVPGEPEPPAAESPPAKRVRKRAP